MPEALPAGLFEVLVSEAVAEGLRSVPADLVTLHDLRSAEAPDRLALLVSRVVARVVESLDEKTRARAGVELARDIVQRLHDAHPSSRVAFDAPDLAARVLTAVRRRRPDGTPDDIVAPLIPLLDTTLLTNSPGEPGVGHQVATEIESADSIDVEMAFIRRSGIRPIEAKLARHCASSRNCEC
jgi:hypothetical protein